MRALSPKKGDLPKPLTLTSDVEFDSEVELDSLPVLLGPTDLLPDHFMRIEPSRYIGRVSRRQGTATLAKHEAEVLAFLQIQVIEDHVEEGLALGAFVQVE